MENHNDSTSANVPKTLQLLIDRVTDGDPVPLEDWLEIHIDRIDDQTIAIGGYHRPEDGYRTELTIASWGDWEEAKEIGRLLAARASAMRLLLNRQPKCLLVINDDA